MLKLNKQQDFFAYLFAFKSIGIIKKSPIVRHILIKNGCNTNSYQNHELLENVS